MTVSVGIRCEQSYASQNLKASSFDYLEGFDS